MPRCTPDPDPGRPLRWQAVLDAERAAMGGAPARPRARAPRAPEALCLSGGGVRSAAFSLGVLQALAANGLLHRFDYLSTVSGGGYVGAWLQRWRLSERSGLRGVIRKLDRAVEPPQLVWLRTNSSYLAPRLGALSPDVWAGVLMTLRNVILNWAVLLPVLLSALSLPWAMRDLFAWTAAAATDRSGPILAGAGTACAFAGLAASGWLRRFAPPGRGGGLFGGLVLAPLFIAAVLLSLAAAAGLRFVPGWTMAAGATLWPTAFGAAIVASRFVGGAEPVFRPVSAADPVPPWLEALLLGVGGGCGGLVLAEVSRLPARLVLACAGPASCHGLAAPSGSLHAALAPPLALLPVLAAQFCFVALSSYGNHGDQDREWFGRAAAILVGVASGWMAAGMLVLMVSTQLGASWTAATVAANLAMAGITARFGFNARTAATRAAAAAAAAVRARPMERGLPLLAWVVILVSAVLLARLDTWAARNAAATLRLPMLRLASALGGSMPDPHRGGWRVLADLFWAGGLLGCALPLSFTLNVNRFSLHGIYRNRLVRTFLGASGAERGRRRDAFTGFSQGDNVPMSRLRCRAPLFPVVNTTLNLVRSANPAWQQRKAASFTITPLHCGSPVTGYRRSTGYGGMRGGVSLGSAMAISGAVASPNMGYHSSPPVSFVMALLNVRLGWWLAHPKDAPRRCRSDGPYWGLGPLLQELLGRTTERSRYVYLSDGGHFENLGVYEMLRRRCRTIVSVDAGCDPDCGFADLGGLVRKARIDLGIEIDFRQMRIEARRSPAVAGVDVAVGAISYPDAPPGRIVYLKPGYHGDGLAMDVRAFASEHAAFPHESTANQFFLEDRFETYRKLGLDAIGGIVASGGGALPRVGRRRLDRFVALAQAMMPDAPPPAPPPPSRSRARRRRWLSRGSGAGTAVGAG